MKKLFVISALIFLPSTIMPTQAANPVVAKSTATAQSKTPANITQLDPGVAKGRALRLEFLSKRLNLTDQQKTGIVAVWDGMEAKWRSINTEYSVKRKALDEEIRKKRQSFEKEFNAKKKPLADENTAKVRELLTATQKMRYEQLLAEEHAKAQKKMHPQKRPRPRNK